MFFVYKQKNDGVPYISISKAFSFRIFRSRNHFILASSLFHSNECSDLAVMVLICIER